MRRSHALSQMRKNPDKDDIVSVGVLSLKAFIFCTVYKKQVKASAGFAASGKELVSVGFFYGGILPEEDGCQRGSVIALRLMFCLDGK